MSGRSYSTDILTSARPESVYDAITKHIDEWWTELSNQALQVGDQLIVRFERTTSWVMTVSEALPSQSLVWKVAEANHDLEGLTTGDEWTGTTIMWTIAGNNAGSKVTLTHDGLVPELQCYEICESGWGHFLTSLKSYLDTGKGHPYRAEIAELR